VRGAVEREGESERERGGREREREGGGGDGRGGMVVLNGQRGGGWGTAGGG